jgi:hypothetical protein
MTTSGDGTTAAHNRSAVVRRPARRDYSGTALLQCSTFAERMAELIRAVLDRVSGHNGYVDMRDLAPRICDAVGVPNRGLDGARSVGEQPCHHDVVRLRRIARLIRNVIHTRTYGYSEDDEYGADVRSTEPPATPELVLDTVVPNPAVIPTDELIHDPTRPHSRT